MIKTKTLYACDFCGKDQYAVAALIAGPRGVMICNECIDQCNEIIAEQRKEKAEKQDKDANSS
jgi:ATP-dependent Clp protease ATP-binding subunit ClpX